MWRLHRLPVSVYDVRHDTWGERLQRKLVQMLDRIEIKQSAGSAAIDVKVNGQEVNGVRAIRFDADAESFPVVTLEVYAEVDIDAEAFTVVYSTENPRKHYVEP